MIPKGWYFQEEEMDDECFNTSQASDLDRIIISPDVLWEPSSVLPSSLRASQTKPRPLDDESSALWRASLGQADQQAVVGCWGFSNMPAKPGAPMKGRSPAESGEVSGGSLDLPVDEDGKSCLRGVIMPQGSGHNINRNANWSHLSDSGVCKSCDDIRMTSAQRLASGPDWYRYPMMGRCMSQDQGLSRPRKSPVDSCNGVQMSSPRAYPRTPTPSRSNIQKRVDQQGPQKPLYLRMKQSQQFYPQHLHTRQSTDAQNYNVYGEHDIYTPIYTMISDNVVSHPMQYPQMKFARASGNQSAQVFPPQWKDSNSGNQGKVFTCQHQGCGKSFKRAEHLNRHRRMHTGERPFACNEPGCDRRFSRTDNLAAHRKIHRKGRSEFGPSNAQVIDPPFKVSSDKGGMAQPLECVVNASDSDANTHMKRSGSIGNFSGEDPNRTNSNLGAIVPKSECSASDAETEGSSATERSGAREMSPVTRHCSGVQNAYQLPLLHERDSMIMSGHAKGVPRYQDPIQQSQHSIHPPLF